MYKPLFAGAKSAGKAIWITMPLPYVLLFVLLVKGCTLSGAGEVGLRILAVWISTLSFVPLNFFPIIP